MDLYDYTNIIKSIMQKLSTFYIINFIYLFPFDNELIIVPISLIVYYYDKFENIMKVSSSCA